MKNYSFSVFPNENFLDLRLFQFGWEQCAPLQSFGPSIRNHFLFHYVISGRGRLDADGPGGVTHHYELSQGEGFLIWPGMVNTYTADRSDPWKYVWIEFEGLRAEEFLREAGLGASQPVYRPKSPAEAQPVEEIMMYIADHGKASTLNLIGHLCLFLDALIQSSSTGREIRSSQLQDFYIQEAVIFMEHNYQRELTVEEVANACRLDRTYFSKLFKKNMGCPPQEFLIRLRLAKAAEMMKKSRTPIGEIAAACGYPNQLHFSRAFKKRYGIPPREWRMKNQGPPTS